MQTPTTGAVVVAVADAEIRAALARLAALGAVDAQPVSGAQLRARWPTAAGVVVDPDAAQTCLAAGLDRRAGVAMVLAGEPAAHAWPIAVALGVEGVFALPRDERQLLDWLAALTEPSTRARVVCCIPAVGGCGSSTLAAGLALGAGGRGQEVLLLDADPCAGGLELLVGAENVGGSRWEDFTDAAGVLSAAVLADSLPSVGQVRILSCGRCSRQALAAPAVESVLAAGRRGHDLVVVDARNSLGEVSSLLTDGADTVVVTVAAEVRAVSAATGLVSALNKRCGDVRLVVRQPGPGSLRPRDVADAVGAPVAAVWARDRKLAALVERGGFSRGWRRTTLAGVVAALLDAMQ
jgi:secretion/DNA translocation related CpaE-like protein